MKKLNIKGLRKSLKMSQDVFRKKIGISQSYLSELETNKKSLSDDLYTEIIENFGIDTVFPFIEEYKSKNTSNATNYGAIGDNSKVSYFNIGSVNERIQLIIKELFNNNVSEFSRVVGVKQPTLNTIIGTRKSKPSFDVINAIASNVPQINTEWLLKGEGSMLKDSDQSAVSYDKKIKTDDIQEINSLKKQLNELVNENAHLKDKIILLEKIIAMYEK